MKIENFRKVYIIIYYWVKDFSEIIVSKGNIDLILILKYFLEYLEKSLIISILEIKKFCLRDIKKYN